jgi:ABC-type spermidine/putrescine transport system permease subunit I
MSASLIALITIVSALVLGFVPVYWVARAQKRAARIKLIRSYTER